MNSLSQKEISGQLFHLSKEAIKTLVLNSKCGILAQVRTAKKSSIDDISMLNNFSPLLCIYRKASPLFIHSKSSHGFDEESFKKEINPSTNALMTLCLLELGEYYSHYNDGKRNITSLEKPYKYLSKEQLIFYSENLRNTEGLFVNKKNASDGYSKGFSLIDKDEKFNFSDQAFMMAAYFLYSYYNKSDPISPEYIRFAHEILDMFKNYKSSLYDLSFSETVQIFLALNIFYKYSFDTDAERLILDLGDFLIYKFQEKDYYLDSLDDCALFSICLMEAYKHTDIISFKETSKEINDKLLNLYDADKNVFVKLSDKKESKYSCLEINFYLLCLLMYSYQDNKINEIKPILSGLYRRFYVNGGLLTSWPEAPTLDEVERYKKLSLRSDDMLDETYFRMPILPTPKGTGLAPIFIKNVTYSKRKDSLNIKKTSFDSNKNMLNFFLIIYVLKDKIEDFMEFNSPFDSGATLNKQGNTVTETNNKSIFENLSEDLLNSDTTTSSDNITPKTYLNETNVEDCTEVPTPKLNGISSLNKTNNIQITKNDTQKITSCAKGKKYKKNKVKHPNKKKK